MMIAKNKKKKTGTLKFLFSSEHCLQAFALYKIYRSSLSLSGYNGNDGNVKSVVLWYAASRFCLGKIRCGMTTPAGKTVQSGPIKILSLCLF